jgi:hypothetical protein
MKLCIKLYIKLLYKALYEALYKALYKALRIEALYKALREALRTGVLYEALCTEALYEALRIEALYEAPHWVPAIFPIASIRTSAKYTPYIYLGSHLIFYPFFLISFLPKGILERQLADDRCRSRTTIAGAR